LRESFIRCNEREIDTGNNILVIDIGLDDDCSIGNNGDIGTDDDDDVTDGGGGENISITAVLDDVISLMLNEVEVISGDGDEDSGAATASEVLGDTNNELP
jgi:hypothetical protein